MFIFNTTTPVCKAKANKKTCLLEVFFSGTIQQASPASAGASSPLSGQREGAKQQQQRRTEPGQLTGETAPWEGSCQRCVCAGEVREVSMHGQAANTLQSCRNCACSRCHSSHRVLPLPKAEWHRPRDHTPCSTASPCHQPSPPRHPGTQQGSRADPQAPHAGQLLPATRGAAQFCRNRAITANKSPCA